MRGGAGLLALVRWIEPDLARRQKWLRRLWWLPAAMIVKFLLLDTLQFRLFEGDQYAHSARVLVNLQALTALVVFALALACYYLSWQMAVPKAGRVPPVGSVMQFLAVLVLLWAGTLEIDRGFERLALTRMAPRDAQRAKQVGISVFWGLYAIGGVAIGFVLRRAALRYFGLGLFAFTLLKVVLVDLAHLGTGYRILSFLALGLLLLGTSVCYGKFSPLLLGEKGIAGAASRSDGADAGAASPGKTA
jgi:uncharacterized membrane protein